MCLLSELVLTSEQTIKYNGLNVQCKEKLLTFDDVGSSNLSSLLNVLYNSPFGAYSKMRYTLVLS